VGGKSLELLLAHGFAGNVRELRNIIGRAVALGAPGAAFSELPLLLRSDPRTSDAQETTVRADRPFHPAKAEIVSRFERSYLEDLLARAGGNVSQAARMGGLERKYLYVLLRKAALLPRRTFRGEQDEPR
jgi:DNA-binding NtrC family response regulator